jgi:NAD(P)-dependent dehydrogenase (short-subunit alcohol dehydrogenase family)
MRLQNKVAVITGAGTGIGEAIAQKFAREGARLVLSGLPADPVQDVADAITNAGGRAVVHLGDLAEELHAHPRRPFPETAPVENAFSSHHARDAGYTFSRRLVKRKRRKTKPSVS